MSCGACYRTRLNDCAAHKKLTALATHLYGTMEDPLIRWDKPCMRLKLRVQKKSAHYKDKDTYVTVDKFTSNTLKNSWNSYNPKTNQVRYASNRISKKVLSCTSNKAIQLHEERRTFKRNFINPSIKEATS